jgi:hypothetical protein
MTTILQAARAAYAAGLCLLPTCDDGSKRPDVPEWMPFKKTRPTVEEMERSTLRTGRASASSAAP